ncbi:MAG: DNA-deoxyinosine glycosylase [bacterium]
MRHPFPPVHRPDSRLLILGTMPSPASFEAGGYYGHPRNAFWRIMDELFGAGPDLTWRTRYDCLLDNGVALWDVLASCEREGSADANILVPVPNNLDPMLGEARLRHLAFNGKTAASLFEKCVDPLASLRQTIHILPSTSGAYPMPYEEKRDAWENALAEAEERA